MYNLPVCLYVIGILVEESDTWLETVPPLHSLASGRTLLVRLGIFLITERIDIEISDLCLVQRHETRGPRKESLQLAGSVDCLDLFALIARQPGRGVGRGQKSQEVL
jgi:hypothetical protein